MMCGRQPVALSVPRRRISDVWAVSRFGVCIGAGTDLLFGMCSVSVRRVDGTRVVQWGHHSPVDLGRGEKKM